MPEKNTEEQDFSQEDEKKFAKNGLRQYGVYSAIVFQLLATMGLSFWGGKKLNDYFEIDSNLLTIGIGFLGMGLAFYSLLRQLKKVQGEDQPALPKNTAPKNGGSGTSS
ncbi:AtpZ/AtpI family protein [Chryseobacterium sp.]|uniref:AtpZ/AtpI family protein n=1 Tax=Chryseobacterium sp. TaxID=1871047 RepID=UPI0011CAAA3B|nr:AtpZ/AtpI family protein [Chryseobacterium sp.]TXF79084.1 AtpZ/AtpI family protein [Chryseobacterium sp.]